MKCQIIIIVWNQFAVTKACLDSVILKTKIPFEIILIDNASKEKTASFLEDFSLRYKDKVRLIRNDENLGFIKAANQGLDYAKADFVCLLNNDTVVTEGWLGELVAAAGENSQIGLLNPSSNTVGQKADLNRIEAFAASLRAYHGQFEEMAVVSGFCMLMRREVIEKVGNLDEAYGMGNFEDTDYSRRAVDAGFLCGRALASYVYHREGTSFFKIRNYDADFRKNQELFYSRWGKPRRVFVAGRIDRILRYGEVLLSLARRNDWIYIAHEKQSILPFKHSNIKRFPLKRAFFESRCLVKILKKVKKKYDYIAIESGTLKKMLIFFNSFHKAKIIGFEELKEL